MPRRSPRLAKLAKERTRGVKRTREEYEEQSESDTEEEENLDMSSKAGDEPEEFNPSSFDSASYSDSENELHSDQFEELEKYKFTSTKSTNSGSPSPPKKMKIDRGGFSTKAKALRTIEFIQGREIRYQRNMIHAFMRGARSILRKAKTNEKKQNINEAIDVFKKWMREYEANKQNIDRYEHLALDTIKKYDVLADFYNTDERKREECEYEGMEIMNVEKDYLKIFEQIKGNIRALRVKQNEKENTTWDRLRVDKLKKLKEILIGYDIRCGGKLKKIDKCLLYYKRGKLKGLPSRIHLQMILWGYTPDKQCIIKLAKNVSKLVKEIKNKHYKSLV